MMAWCESLTGFTEEAREHAALGLRLSPRDNELWLGAAYLALAQASFADGDFEQTREWGKLAIQKTIDVISRSAVNPPAAGLTKSADVKSPRPKPTSVKC